MSDLFCGYEDYTSELYPLLPFALKFKNAMEIFNQFQILRTLFLHIH